MKRIYLASPFFNKNQLGRLEKVEQILDEKFQMVFSPRKAQYEGLEFGSMDWRTEVFLNNQKHIDNADVVVAIYDEEDAGTMWEIGYAYGKGIPVVIFQHLSTPVNLMISDSLHSYINGFKELKEYDFDQLKPSVYKGEVF
jgi:nucleoside 2-deoxyribosyltransferase